MVRASTPQGQLWECATCTGRAMTVGLMRKLKDPKAVGELWLAARRAPLAEGRPCPSCTRAMHAIGSGEGRDHLELDVCLACHFVFFDPGEFGRTPDQAPAEEEDPKNLPLEARRALAMAKIEAIKQSADEQMTPSPASPLMWIPLVFGLPVELADHKTTNVPLLTWCLALVTVVLGVATFGSIDEVAQAWGLVPAEAARYGGATLITAFFLHAGAGHLIGNIYFWLVFGDNLEEVLGWKRYLLLLFGATVAGGLAHLATNAGSTVPAIGASGGISGLLVAYAIRFPRAKIGMLVFFRLFRVPVWGYLLAWVAVQFVGYTVDVYTVGEASVAYGAHLGGAAFGLVLGWRWRTVD